MSDTTREREYDIVLYGATGFAGALTAEYLATALPATAKWALAGRNRSKLESVAEKLVALNGAAAVPEILIADATRFDTLEEMARLATVVITTVGPYFEYGEPLVQACAENGTAYVDLTGEAEFTDQMYLKYHDIAEESGARIVHACGFDSIPHDIGVYFTMNEVPEDMPVAVRGAVRTNAAFSGGTYHTAIGSMSRMREGQRLAARRKKVQGKPAARKVRYVIGKLHRDEILGRWLVPMPLIDPQIVVRSAAALDSYGPDFTYSHYASVGKLPTAVAGMVGAVAIAGAAQVKFTQDLILSRIERGSGPSEAKRARSSFEVTFVAEAGGRTIVTRVSGGDPGYTETAKMLSESAMCLAFDDNPKVSGQLTTAQAMGENLLARLQSAGLKFEVLQG